MLVAIIVAVLAAVVVIVAVAAALALREPACTHVWDTEHGVRLLAAPRG